MFRFQVLKNQHSAQILLWKLSFLDEYYSYSGTLEKIRGLGLGMMGNTSFYREKYHGWI